MYKLNLFPSYFHDRSDLGKQQCPVNSQSKILLCGSSKIRLNNIKYENNEFALRLAFEILSSGQEPRRPEHCDLSSSS